MQPAFYAVPPHRRFAHTPSASAAAQLCAGLLAVAAANAAWAQALATPPAPTPLAATQAEPVDPAWTELARPGSSVELGVAVRSRYAQKAEEFSGITGKGPTLIGGFELHGGAPFDGLQGLRWRAGGVKLGQGARSIDADMGEQGRWQLKIGYDELRHNTGNGFESPYLGIGSARLTLPGHWVVPVVPRVSTTAPNARGLSPAVTAANAVVAGSSIAPTAAQAAAATALQAADLPAFQAVDVFTRRTRFDVGSTIELAPRWSFSTQLTHEHKTGLKPQAAQSRAVGGDTSSILPAPVDQTDNRYALHLAYQGEQWQVQAGFEGSSFMNQVPAVSWSLWAAPGITATLAGAPSNQFHKFSLAGSVQLAPGWRFVGEASRGRATQDQAFLGDTTAVIVPATSAHALVLTDDIHLKLLGQPLPQWHLNAGYQYTRRDNRTPVNLYGYYDNNNPPAGSSPFAYLFPTLTGLGQNLNLNANTPFSLRTQRFRVDADRGWASHQHMHLGAEWQQTDRECHGTWAPCANAPRSQEGSLRGEWRAEPTEQVSARLGLTAARRRVDYAENAFLALVPMAGQTPGTATGALAGSTALVTLQALGLTGYGPSLGLAPAALAGSTLGFYFPLNNVLSNVLYGNQNRISELLGMRRHDQANRQRGAVRASLAWQPSDAWSLQAGLDHRDDRYPDSRYGLQRARAWALNLDAGYAPSDALTLGVFASHEAQRTRIASNSYTANSAATSVNGATAIDGGCFTTIALRNASNKIDPCLDWASNTRGATTTLGAHVAAPKLLGGRLALTGQASVSRSRTDIDVSGGNYVNNPYAGVAGQPDRATAAFYIPASALPTVAVNSIDLQLSGTWRLSPASALRLSGGYQRIRITDWAYDALQAGGLTQVLPSNEQAPNHDVSWLGVSYILHFR